MSEIHKVYSACIHEDKVLKIGVEVSLSRGLPYYQVVGLGDSAVKESKERIRQAFRNLGINLPNKRITVNLSPAWVSKKGSGFDLPIALALLQAMGIVPDGLILAAMGELSLTGDIRDGPEDLALVSAFTKFSDSPIDIVLLPYLCKERLENYYEGGYYFHNLGECVSFLKKCKHPKPRENENKPSMPFVFKPNFSATKIVPPDFNINLKLQEIAWRALNIALAGNHHLLMLGAKGSGKTTLARAGKYLLPPLKEDKIFNKIREYAIAGLLYPDQGGSPPFREPHFSISQAALLGGSYRYPFGEVTLASGGILFLDEISEFSPSTLNLLRTCVEERSISQTKNGLTKRFDTNFILIACANPCACGQYFEEGNKCTCTDGDLARYRRKFQNPFFDRFDLFVEMYSIPNAILDQSLKDRDFSFESAREAIEDARERQWARQGQEPDKLLRLNGSIPIGEFKNHLFIEDKALDRVKQLSGPLDLSVRAFQKVLRVARTIADLDGSQNVKEAHALEALTYRRLSL